jgi:hypothetical protein
MDPLLLSLLTTPVWTPPTAASLIVGGLRQWQHILSTRSSLGREGDDRDHELCTVVIELIEHFRRAASPWFFVFRVALWVAVGRAPPDDEQIPVGIGAFRVHKCL